MVVPLAGIFELASSLFCSGHSITNLLGSLERSKQKNGSTIIITKTARSIISSNLISKVTQSQQGNLRTSSACSIILWTQTGDAIKPLKCRKG